MKLTLCFLMVALACSGQTPERPEPSRVGIIHPIYIPENAERQKVFDDAFTDILRRWSVTNHQDVATNALPVKTNTYSYIAFPRKDYDWITITNVWPEATCEVRREIVVSNEVHGKELLMRLRSGEIPTNHYRVADLILSRDICYSNTTAVVKWRGKEFLVPLESKELWRTNRVDWR